MVTVKLTKIDFINNRYVITLGNGALYEFTNLKKAKQFNCELSKFLTIKTYHLNEVLSDVYKVSRDLWKIAENQRNRAKTHKVYHKQVNDSINDIAFWLDFLVSSRCYSAIYAFILVDKICREIDKVIATYQQSFSAFPVYLFSVKIERIKAENRQIYQSIKTYGLDNCTKIIDVQRFEDLQIIINSKTA